MTPSASMLRLHPADPTRWTASVLPAARFIVKAVSVAGLMLLTPMAHAQAGPPMITNDPGTPGAGVWEINLAATGGRGHSRWDIAAPDFDINRGVGNRVQLSVHGSWAHRHDDNGWSSGMGDAELGLRWRFLDQDTTGFSVAIQPLWINGWSSSARRKELATSHREFILPLQIAQQRGTFAIGAEIARRFIADADDEWQAGAYAARDCGAARTCLAEINTHWRHDDGASSTLNFGGRQALGQHASLMASFGSELRGLERQPLIFYLGVQLVADSAENTAAGTSQPALTDKPRQPRVPVRRSRPGWGAIDEVLTGLRMRLPG